MRADGYRSRHCFYSLTYRINFTVLVLPVACFTPAYDKCNRRQTSYPFASCCIRIPRKVTSLQAKLFLGNDTQGWRLCCSSRRKKYRRADNFQPVSFTVGAWEWVYATNLSRLRRETSKRHVGEAHSVLTAILLPQRLSCYWFRIVSLRMLTNLWVVDLRLTTARQRSTGQNLPSDL
jgi:hypothetical protein